MTMNLNIFHFFCWIIVSTLVSAVSTADHRRFLFDFVYDCQHCFQCACQLQRCPNWNIFEISGAYTQCAFTLKDLDCFSPFHEDGGWTLWSEWNTCTGSCTSGTRERTRTCTNPAPHNCGKHCEGDDKDVDYDCIPSWCKTTGLQATRNITQEITTPELSTKTTFTDKSSQLSSVSTESFSVAPQSPNLSSTTSSSTSTGKEEVSTTDLSSRISPEASSTPTALVSQNITPTPPFDIGICGYYCSLNALITQERLTDPRAKICQGGSHDGEDALPMVCCNISQSADWKAEENVLQHCDSIRMYNPVSSFIEGSLLNGTSGIFLGCIENGTGFQMLRQDCAKATHLVRVTEQQDQFPPPSTFFVVV